MWGIWGSTLRGFWFRRGDEEIGGCEIWYLWERRWQVVKIFFECTFPVMLS